MSSIRVGSFVTCSRLGSDEFEVVSENTRTGEVRLKSLKTGKEENIFAVHCSRGSAEMQRRNARLRSAEREARAAKIGNPTPKKR